MKTDKNLIKLVHDYYCIKNNTIYCGLNPCCEMAKTVQNCKQCDFYRGLYYTDVKSEII